MSVLCDASMPQSAINKGECMTEVRLHAKTSALLLQDLQNDLVKGSRPVAPLGGAEVIANCQKLLAQAREVGMLVVHVRVSRRPDLKDAPRPPLGTSPAAGGPQVLIEGTAGAHIVSELAPRPEDVVVTKHTTSPFHTTERVEIGTLVVCNSFRNPALLAKMAETVDEISGGRLILGIGAGWNKPEYDAFGFPFHRIRDRFEEAAQIIKPLLVDRQASFAGDYYQLKDCEITPRGPREGGVPVMIGAIAHKTSLSPVRSSARSRSRISIRF